MIYLRVLLALLTFSLLVLTRFDTGENIEQNNNFSSFNIKNFSSLQKELYPVEKAWFDAEEKANKPKESENVETSQLIIDPKALLINGVSYRLLAVFNDGKKAFILLRDSKGEINKLYVDDKITDGVVLKDVKPHRITVVQQDQEINFDLFKRSNNEHN